MLRVLKVNPGAGASGSLTDQSKTPGRNLSVYAYKNTQRLAHSSERAHHPNCEDTMQGRPNKHAENLNSHGLPVRAVWHQHFQLPFGCGHKGTPVIPFGGVLCARHWGTQGLRAPSDTAMLPGEHSDCFHLAEEVAKPCRVISPGSHSCPNRIFAHVYLPLDSELGGAVSYPQGPRTGSSSTFSTEEFLKFLKLLQSGNINMDIKLSQEIRENLQILPQWHALGTAVS